MRVLIALGGNAMTSPDGAARPDDQRRAIAVAMESVADLVAAGHDVALTHGNGPQVGNLLVKNEVAAHIVPPVSLDWCVAQTQGTIGFTIADELERALAQRGTRRQVAAIVTRTLVDPADPGFAAPSKPIGRYVTEAEAAAMIAHGQIWQDRGERGWRRVVASPDPIEIIETPTIAALLAAGTVVVAAGGGGIPVVRDSSGLTGVEAVIDKDLSAAVLARSLEADALVIATDVDHAVLGWGTDQARNVGRVTLREMQSLAEQGHFASGSMGPKIDAAMRFVAGGGPRSVITSLTHIRDGIEQSFGTVVVPD